MCACCVYLLCLRQSVDQVCVIEDVAFGLGKQRQNLCLDVEELSVQTKVQSIVRHLKTLMRVGAERKLIQKQKLRKKRLIQAVQREKEVMEVCMIERRTPKR